MTFDFSYDAVHSALAAHEAVVTASEAHGLLAGMVCVHADVALTTWLGELFEDQAMAEQWHGSGGDILIQLFAQTRKEITAQSSQFELLLPDDEVDLGERAEALGQWCQGFVYGFGAFGERGDWPGDCDELVRDFLEISKIEPEGGDDEDDENALMELTEFVRVGVQLVYSELSTGSAFDNGI